MIYRLTLFLFLTLTPAILLCQSANINNDKGEDKVVFKQDIGLNAIGMFRAIFSTEESDLVTPYLFSYNIKFKKMVLRAGLGPRYITSTETHAGFTDSQINTELDLDWRIGLGWDIIQEKKWTVRTGFDVVGGYSLDQKSDDTGFDKITNKQTDWNIGAGPFAQVIFHISPRISLSTEAGLYGTHFNTKITEEYENFPEFNDQLSETTGFRLDAYIPTSLFIHFHF